MRNEKRETKLDGAKAVVNSGRGFRKGDAILDDKYLIDYKHVTSSHTIKINAWNKHAKDAWNEGHLSPLIKVVFGEDATAVAIIDWEEFVQMKEIAWMYEDLCD